MATTNAVPIDPANAEQFRAWDGDEGAFWSTHADHFEQALARYDESFFASAAIARTDRVLDIGCGTGGTTRVAALAATDGSVLGVDLSSAMLEVARRRAADAGIGNVHYEQVDAQVHSFEPAAFDVVVGRTSAMFFGDRVAGLANVGRALRPDGRLVLLTWQPFPRQEWIGDFSGAFAVGRDLPSPPPDAPGPFSLAEPEVINSVLIAAGYTNITLENRCEPMWFGADADDAYQFVSGQLAWMLEGLHDDARTRAHDALRTTVAAHETREGVVYDSAAWIVSATHP